MIAVSSTAMLDQGAAMTAIALVLARIAPTVAPCVEACRNFGMLGRVLINLRRCPLRSDTDRHCATAANVAMGHKRSFLSRSLNQAVASDDGEAGDRGDRLTHC
jgi:hypothetical protein